MLTCTAGGSVSHQIHTTPAECADPHAGGAGGEGRDPASQSCGEAVGGWGAAQAVGGAARRLRDLSRDAAGAQVTSCCALQEAEAVQGRLSCCCQFV